MVSRVQSLVANHSLATTAKVGEFINARHADLLESHDWSRRKQDIIINTAVDKTDGTVALTSGSGAVVGTSTTFAATDVGRSFQLADSIYVIKTRTSTTDITLGDANGTAVLYPGANLTGQAYVIFTQFYSLGTGIEQILGVKYKAPLTEKSEEWLDSMDPSRQGTGDPIHYVRTSRGSSDDVRIEVYPRPATAISINVKIEKGHTDLSGSQTPIVPNGTVERWAAVDCCYYLFGKTKDEAWLKLAAKYETIATQRQEFDQNQDAKKFGVIQQIQDVGGGTGLSGTDFGLDHDTGVN
jgi:hypothetical protein